MRQVLTRLTIGTEGRGLLEVTPRLEAFVSGAAIAQGLLTVFCRHTSASLLIQENAAPEARADLERFFEEIAPEAGGRYAHDEEGPDDMPAHLRAALSQTSLAIPVSDGRVVLGVWQGVYLFEHRRRGSSRELVLHLIGA